LNQRLASPLLLRYIETLTGPYADLSKAYRKCVSGGGGASGGSAGAGGAGSAHVEFAHLVEAHAESFQADKNLGLVKQILSALQKKQITRLTQTYITCSIEDVAAHMAVAAPHGAQAAPAASHAQAERKVFDMVSRKDIPNVLM
jgi:hypothetical protein